jgi:hypothetical protein
MKILLIILSCINGGFMLLDGIYVMLKGKYIGPPKPGPWASLFYKLQIDVFKLGPLFVAYGLAWLLFLFAVVTQQAWAYTLGIGVAIATLWYLPVGTMVAVTVLIILFAARAKTGI